MMNTKTSFKNRVIDIDYEKNKISWYYYLPLLLIAGFVPLIVYGKYVDLNGTTQALYWTGQNIYLDFFSYWKSRWIIFLTAISLFIYIFLLISKKLPFKKEFKYYIPIGIYAFLVILSIIFAIDVPTALNGFVDMYQGMWVLLSYVTMTFLMINFVNSERDVKLFLYAFIFLIIAEGLLGVGQYFGFDIFNTKFGNSLIIPSGVQVDGGLTFNFGKHTIYGTLFNTNFVGSFATLMIPVVVVFLISADTIKKYIIAIISLILCLFTWIGCNSRAGYLGVAIMIIVSIILLSRHILKHWKIGAGIFIIFLISLFILNIISGGKVINQFSRMNIFNELSILKNSDDNLSPKFKSIDIKNNIISIDSNFQSLNIKLDGDKIYFYDKDWNQLNIVDDNGLLIPEIGQSLRVDIDNYPVITVTTPWGDFGTINFLVTEDGIKIIGSGGRLINPLIAPYSRMLDGLETFMSGRGYIWGRTIPLLNKYFIIGAGADNFTYAFPQDDCVAKINMNMGVNTVIDKPHNMYFQIAVNTGVLSLLSLLVLWTIYIITSIKIYSKISLDSLEKYMGLACLLSVIGYLVAGIVNDYIVSVAPLFWIILGLGISINIRIKKKEDANV